VLASYAVFRLGIIDLVWDQERVLRDAVKPLEPPSERPNAVIRHGQAELSLRGSEYVYIWRDNACDYEF
jgi:hypothetical protein